MKKQSLIFGLAISGMLLAGCAENPDMARNAAIGTGVGAVAGLALGDNHESAITGAVVGGLIGSQIRSGSNNNNYQSYDQNYNSGYANQQYNSGYANGYQQSGYGY
ncbi:MAG: single-stranded DNA-binding protein [Cardiobacteriaceae bacterium]|nr:single-stranded DNA-binding protein [Cardiobacteriaceae bacterium]